MKKLLIFIGTIFISTFAIAHTIEWYVGDSLLSTTTCSSGDSITPPTAPAKYGYTFDKWDVPYTKLEYIEATGTQWIDTGVSIAGGNIIEAKVLPVNGQAFIGNVGSNFNATRNLVQYSNDRYFYQKLNNYHNDFFDDGTTPAIVYLNTIGTTFYGTCNGNTAVDTTTGVLQDYQLTVKISKYDYTNTMFSGRYYWVKISDSTGLLVRNLVPVRAPDSTIGMYDTVTNTFFENAGTGTFIAGPEIGDL